MRLPGAEVVVIGGGVMGTSIAYQLAKRGVDVALVERFGLASGASRANGTSVLMQTKTAGPKLEFALDSLAIYRGLEQELGQDLEFVNDGGMVVAETEDQVEYLKSRVAQLRAHGLEIYFLDRDEARSRQPALGGHICGSSYCPDDSTVNPFRLTVAWAEAATRLGARILTETAVTGLKVRCGRVASVTTSAGELGADAVVNACGVWAPAIAQWVELDLPVVPQRGQLSVTEAVPVFIVGKVLAAQYLMSKKAPASTSSKSDGLNPGAVFHQTKHGNLLFGSTRELVGFDTCVTAPGQEALARHLVRLIPAARHLHVIRTFAGLRPSTPDGLPILERSPDIPNFYVTTGHGGDGIALSPITGLRMAQLITGEIYEDQLRPFSSSRFRDHGQ